MYNTSSCEWKRSWSTNENADGILRDIASRSKRAWEERPLHSRYDPSLWETLRPVWKCRHLLGIWQEHMYNDFLVQRIMVQQLHADPEGLSELAYELLSGTLILVGPQSGEDISDLPWTVRSPLRVEKLGLLIIARLPTSVYRLPESLRSNC